MLVVGIIMFAAFIIGTGLIVQLITDREGFKRIDWKGIFLKICALIAFFGGTHLLKQYNILPIDGFQMVFRFWPLFFAYLGIKALWPSDNYNFAAGAFSIGFFLVMTYVILVAQFINPEELTTASKIVGIIYLSLWPLGIGWILLSLRLNKKRLEAKYEATHQAAQRRINNNK
ncbi:MAG: hypothetical protein GX020_02535 [Firmicutes bacterium]|jgi:hypothetical protein|nr:hypothetical protein [Bacillota bacterium]